jgi:hypothetical protein
MLLSRVRTGVVLAAAWAGAADAADPRPVAPSSAPTLAGVVAPAHREAVTEVVRHPTLTAKAAEEPFASSARVYDFLLDHPDRTAQAWRRMGVPCVEITDLGRGQFGWTDHNGSEIIWQVAGRFPDGLVWLATGKVKPGALLPAVPVKAVAVLHAPRAADKVGTTLTPSVRVYLLTDSRAATTVLKMFGSAVPKMAEQGAEQLLLFFSGVATYVNQYPDKAEALLAPASKK